jgi:hypothetical protein
MGEAKRPGAEVDSSRRQAFVKGEQKMRHLRSLSRVSVLVAVLLTPFCSAPIAEGQSIFGSVRGAVLDQSGLAIPETRVVLHSLDEGTDMSVVSDNDGNFLFENLKPGRYKLTASKNNFTTTVVNQVELTDRQALRLEVKLSVASKVERVEVSGAPDLVNTENGTLSSAELGEELTTLPINSRAVSSSPLANLATNPNVTTDTQGNINVGGSSSAQTGYSVDGISTANVRANGALKDAYPSLEGIQEMNVTAFNNNAEFAQMGDVTFTTKSGTEQLHGSAFEYFQNDTLDSTIYSFSSKAPKTFNTFGGSLGGPVTIPKLWNGSRKKTFFFFDYEGNRKRTSAPELLLVPTQAERNGDLTALYEPRVTSRRLIPIPGRFTPTT